MYNIRIIIILLVCIFIINSCHLNLNKKEKKSVDTEIYNIFLKHWLNDNHDSTIKRLIIRKETGVHGLGGENETNEILQNLKAHMPELKHNTAINFQEKNVSSVILYEKPKLPIETVYISSGRFDKEFKNNDAWLNFYNKYPNSQGIMILSRIGFNNDENQALLYCCNYCGALCGGGWFVLFKKEKNRWVLEKFVLAWIS